MTALMRAATAELEAGDLQLAWLGGDRHRYARHGFAPGGRALHYAFEAAMLPPADPACTPQRMSAAELIDALAAQQRSLASALLLSRAELELLVAARRPLGLRLDDAFVILDADAGELYFAAGPLDTLARLLAHVLAGGPHQQLLASCADEAGDLCRLGTNYASYIRSLPTCLWRVTTLARTLTAAASIAATRVGPGRDVLGLRNSETGEVATLRIDDGAITVEAGGRPTIELDTAGLSALCFGTGPLELFIPGLRPDSPLRRVLPIPAYYHTRCWRL
jgi:hypothetical protein